MDILQKYKRFIELAGFAQLVRDNPNLSWEVKYDIVFSDSVHGEIKKLFPHFDWYDPDASYSDDVRAYVDALVSRAEELVPTLELQYPTGDGL